MHGFVRTGPALMVWICPPYTVWPKTFASVSSAIFWIQPQFSVASNSRRSRCCSPIISWTFYTPYFFALLAEKILKGISLAANYPHSRISEAEIRSLYSRKMLPVPAGFLTLMATRRSRGERPCHLPLHFPETGRPLRWNSITASSVFISFPRQLVDEIFPPVIWNHLRGTLRSDLSGTAANGKCVLRCITCSSITPSGFSTAAVCSCDFTLYLERYASEVNFEKSTSVPGIENFSSLWADSESCRIYFGLSASVLLIQVHCSALTVLYFLKILADEAISAVIFYRKSAAVPYQHTGIHWFHRRPPVQMKVPKLARLRLLAGSGSSWFSVCPPTGSSATRHRGRRWQTSGCR